MEHHLFYLKRDGVVLSTGYYEDGKFIVLKGSIYNYARVLSPIMKEQSRLEEDKVFSSPSSAGEFCLSKRTCNGWAEWKDADGNTLDAVYRKSSNSVNTE